MNRQIALAEAYSTRNNTVQSAQIEAAMSEDFADIYVKWQQGGSKSLSDAERFRVESWEVARMFRAESQYIMWQQGLLPDEFIETLRDITLRNVQGWRDLDITWIPIGGYRDEVNRALAEIDRREPVEAEGT